MGGGGGAKGQPAENTTQAEAVILDPNIPPTDRTANCTISGCHAVVIEKPYLHGPLAVNACLVCHEYDEPSAHTFQFDRKDAAMCNYCHIGVAANNPQHEPVREGKCLECHDPHSATEAYLPRLDTIGETCLTCHEETLTAENTHIHTPVAGFACTECHGGHAGTHAKLLKAEPTELCLSCHPNTKQELNRLDCIHSPVAESCLNCHNPHSSPIENQLLAPPAELCGSCHEREVEIAKHALVGHSIVLDDERACLNCHNPHAGARDAALLRGQSIEVCLNCHHEPIETADGRTIPDIADVRDPDVFLHGPLKSGECRGCHEPHGSDHRALLPAKFENSFYGSDNPDKFDLCFECHSPNLAQEEHSLTATNFRNGDRNLHFLHVTNPKRIGRNCGVCHSIHASKQAFHMNDSVLFGKWLLPIELKPAENGGTCAAGCHREASYDRVTPAVNDWEPAVKDPPPAAPAPNSGTDN